MAENGTVSRSNSQCLTREEMLAYQSGSLTPSEMHALEIHLSDCPFCSDALEGLETMDSPSSFTGADDDLKIRLHDLIESEKGARIRVLFPWRIAAAFALLLASLATLWLAIPDQSETEMISEAFEPYPAPGSQPTQAQEQLRIPEQNKVVTEPPNQVEDVKQVTPSTKGQEEIPPAFSTSESSDDEIYSDKALSEPARVVENDLATADERKAETQTGMTAEAEPNTAEMNEVVVVSSTNRKSKTREESATRKAAAAETVSKENIADSPVSDNRFGEAMRLYNEGNYRQALVILRQIPATANSSFYAGICSYSLGSYDDAEQFFGNTIRSKETTLLEAAHWYLGLTLLKQGDKKEARRQLQTVIRFNGEFKTKAEKLLQEL